MGEFRNLEITESSRAVNLGEMCKMRCAWEYKGEAKSVVLYAVIGNAGIFGFDEIEKQLQSRQLQASTDWKRYETYTFIVCTDRLNPTGGKDPFPYDLRFKVDGHWSPVLKDRLAIVASADYIFGNDADVYAGQTAGQVTDPNYEWKKLGSADNPTQQSITSNVLWDTYTKAGDKNAYVITFKILPDFLEEPVRLAVEGGLRAKGVDVWKPSEFKGNTMIVYFKTGLAPLVIAAIVIGVLVTIGIICVTIALYNLRKIEVESTAERAKTVTEATQGRQDLTFEELMKQIELIEDPSERAQRLKELIEQEQEYAQEAEEDVLNSQESFTDILKSSVMYLVIGALILGGLYVFLQFKKG